MLSSSRKSLAHSLGWEWWRTPVIQCLGGRELRRSSRRSCNFAQVLAGRKLPEILPAELAAAERLWWIKSQWDSFPLEMSALSKEKSVEKSSRLYTLSPYLEDGVMRLNGRIDRGSLPDAVKRPVILDPKHRFTRLLILYHHVQNHHQGQALVANELRQKYWILHVRTAVRSVWNSCPLCKILRSKPSTPEMGQLPEFRLKKSIRPFTITGLDYFGPMEVTVGRRREKRYGVLFTCLQTRAVHLEIATSLSTDSAIMAIRCSKRMSGPTLLG